MDVKIFAAFAVALFFVASPVSAQTSPAPAATSQAQIDTSTPQFAAVDFTIATSSQKVANAPIAVTLGIVNRAQYAATYQVVYDFYSVPKEGASPRWQYSLPERDTVTLGVGEQTFINKTLPSPELLNGTYRVVARVITSTYRIAGGMYLGEATFSATPSVSVSQCSISGKNLSVDNGVSFAESERPSSFVLTCLAKNNSAKTISAAAGLTLQDLSDGTESKVGQTAVTLGGNKETRFSITSTNQVTPGRYGFRLTLDDGNMSPFAKPIIGHVSVAGVGAVIEDVALENVQYKKGDTARIGLLARKFGTDEYTLNLSLKGGQTLCAATTTRPSFVGEERFELPVTRNCGPIILRAEIRDSKGNSLDVFERTYGTEETALPMNAKTAAMFLIVVLAALAAAIILIKKYKIKNAVPPTLAILILAASGALSLPGTSEGAFKTALWIIVGPPQQCWVEQNGEKDIGGAINFSPSSVESGGNITATINGYAYSSLYQADGTLDASGGGTMPSFSVGCSALDAQVPCADSRVFVAPAATGTYTATLSPSGLLPLTPTEPDCDGSGWRTPAPESSSYSYTVVPQPSGQCEFSCDASIQYKANATNPLIDFQCPVGQRIRTNGGTWTGGTDCVGNFQLSPGNGTMSCFADVACSAPVTCSYNAATQGTIYWGTGNACLNSTISVSDIAVGGQVAVPSQTSYTGSATYTCTSSGGWSGPTNVSCNPPAPGSCSATTINNCDLPTTPSGSSAGSCSSGYTGSCNYSCTNEVWNSNSNSCVVPSVLGITVSPASYSVTLPSDTITATYTLTNGNSANTICRLLDNTGSPLTTYSSCTGNAGVTAPGIANTYGYSIQAYQSSTGQTVPSNSFTVTVNPASNPIVQEPNLIAGGVSPTNATAGTATTFNSTISNIGSRSTGASFNNLMQVATSPNGGGTINDILPPVNMDTLGAESSNTFSKLYTFASNGSYSLRVCADKSSAGDAYGTITEAGESDNCGEWTNIVVSSASPVPTATLSANPATINQGQSSTLAWNSTNATSCIGTGFTAGGASGFRSTGALSSPGTYNYQVVCSGIGGSSSPDFASVTVLAPSADISANPARVSSGNSTTISWNATGVNSCSVSGPGLSSTGLTGSRSLSITAQSTFTITCTTSGAPITKSVIVNIVPAFEEF